MREISHLIDVLLKRLLLTRVIFLVFITVGLRIPAPVGSYGNKPFLVDPCVRLEMSMYCKTNGGQHTRIYGVNKIIC